MAADYNRESRSFGLEVQLCQIVQHVDGNAAELEHRRLRQLARPRTFVDVAPHGSHRGNRGKLFEDLRSTDIAGMNDVFRPAQSFNGLRSQQAMRIGDDAD